MGALRPGEIVRLHGHGKWDARRAWRFVKIPTPGFAKIIWRNRWGCLIERVVPLVDLSKGGP